MTTAAKPPSTTSPSDPSQPIKADGGLTGAQAPAPAPERSPTPTGPKASDIPADQIVQAGQEAGSRNEYSISKVDLMRLLAIHFGVDPKRGQIELLWNDADLGGVKMIHSS